MLGLFQTIQAQTIYALSGSKLVSFSAQSPATLLSNVGVTGIAAGQDIAGMDFRPNTGELFALGYNQTTGGAQLYTINLTTGAATAIGASIALKTNMGKVSMDFNPTVDRIRVTGSDNSNYRLHPVTGAIAATDLNLAFAGTDVNAAATPSIGTGAYTNSYIGATATTLYNYDDALNVLTTQIPPNNGTLNTVGSSGISVNGADPSSDLDIFFDAAAGMNRAYLAANTGADLNDKLYSINLTSGAATLIGNIGNGIAVSDIAVLIDRTVPAKVTGRLIYALASNGNLISFDSDLPGTIRRVVTISGLAMGQVLSGLDVRPATGELYGFGYNTATGEGRLYTIDPTTGIAKAIGTEAFTLKAGMGKVSMDFNPTVDRVRVTGSDNSNYRLHPVTGAVAATDGTLAFAASDVNAGTNPSVGTGAYTNSFNGATATTLYNYDDSLNVLTTQIPPNNGTLNTVGASGIVVNLADPSADLDIVYNPYSGGNMAFLAANVGTSAFDNLYTVNLTTGAATLVGRIGNGIAIVDIAATTQAAEVACDVKTIGCVKYELLSIVRDASGNKTYRIRVTNTCADALNYVAFQIPNGVNAVGSLNNSTYTSLGGRNYDVRNPNFSPFYSIRFKSQGTNGIANGQLDAFEYTLPATANPNFIYVSARVGAASYDTYINVFSCTVGTPSPPSSKPEDGINDRDDASLLATSELRVFPNPTEGLLFADLSAWAGQEVQIRAFNAQGQMLLNASVAGGNTQHTVELSNNLTSGLYFLEVTAADGAKQSRRFMVRR